MPRNMSFMLTQPQVRNQTKTVTRRNGWKFVNPGDILNAVEKSQGLRKGEKVVKITQIRVLTTNWEPLRRMIDEPDYGASEVKLEGFPGMTPQEFVDMYCKHNKCTPDTLVNRISFRYL